MENDGKAPSIAEGIEQLCLGEELTAVVASRLGAVPRSATVPSPAESPLATPSPGGTPSLKRGQRRRNRRDRRRGPEGEELPPRPLTRVEKLRAQGVQRSSSEQSVPQMSTSSTLGLAGCDAAALLFKSQSSVSVNTGVRNLPESFFSDQLPEDEEAQEKEKRRKGKKRSKAAANAENSESKEILESNFEKEKKTEEEDEDKENLAAENLFGDPEVRGEDEDEDGKEEQQAVYNWRNVTRNGDIKKCVLVEGQVRDGGRPKSGDVVLVKSQGKLKNGTMIDDYPTLVFRVGEYEVIEGLDLAVQSMYKNELAIISIKPPLAYGDLGRKPDIPPDSRITYLFGLLHFEKQKEMAEMTWAQRRKMGQSRMRIANWWYARKEYPIAVKCYKKALQFYNNIPTNQECSTAEEYKELLTLMEERLRVMRQVANIFKRIANLIQNGQIEA